MPTEHHIYSFSFILTTLTSGLLAVEAFHAFQEAHTPAWHEDRHTHAQAFLDLFMRQNIAEIDEIPSSEHWHTIMQPAGEKAIYVELDHHVKAMDMNVTRKGNSKNGGDRDSRLRSALGDSSSAEEALLKSLCHFSLNMGELDSKATARTACDHIVKQREEQLENNKEELLKVLRSALLKVHQSSNPAIPKAENPFLKFVEQKRRASLEDADATSTFREILQDAKNWAVRNRKNKKALDDDNIKRDADANESDDDGNAVQRASSRDNDIVMYREEKIQVNRLLKELVGRFRSLRFFKVVRQVQAKDPNHRWICACEPQRNFPLEGISVSSICGHSACFECMARSVERKQCPRKDSGCESLVPQASIVPVASLGADYDSTTPHGVKLDSLVRLLQNVIPANEKVLLFIQFPDLLKKVFSVLQEAGVGVAQLAGTTKARSNELTLFQNENGSRVLLLEAMSETAAGANLTVANHVIFLSPLATVNYQQYSAAETQAIGRVRRYGQKRHVHIWRFAVLDTIDVEIYEERKNPVRGSD